MGERGRASRGRTVPALTWEGESSLQRADRRSHLGLLDRVLEVLEELNLEGALALPPELVRQLQICGISPLPGETPSAVLERVLNGQESYLLHPVAVAPERSEGQRQRARKTDL